MYFKLMKNNALFHLYPKLLRCPIALNRLPTRISKVRAKLLLKIEEGVYGYQLILMQKSSVHTFTLLNA